MRCTCTDKTADPTISFYHCGVITVPHLTAKLSRDATYIVGAFHRYVVVTSSNINVCFVNLRYRTDESTHVLSIFRFDGATFRITVHNVDFECTITTITVTQYTTDTTFRGLNSGIHKGAVNNGTTGVCTTNTATIFRIKRKGTVFHMTVSNAVSVCHTANTAVVNAF